MDRILNADLAIQIHLVTVAIALAMTLVILPLKKGTALHKIAGRVWMVSMMITAIATFWINSFDLFLGFSPIHIFSLVTLYSVPMAYIAIRRGDVKTHKQSLTGVMIGGLGIAGALAFTPGRLMHALVFG
ncbi:MAG: DUF2306 domain-containing protein [Pseudomonadota bacterium]